MSKRCPACGYGPIGPFIDNCPICAEPVRNVRGVCSGRTGSPPPWLWWILGGAGAIVLAVVGCCGLSIWRMGEQAKEAIAQAEAQREADRRARTVVVTAADLLQEFQDNPAAADEKYTRAYLELTGVVERVGRGRHDAPFVVLHAGDESVKIKIECFFDSYDQPIEGRVRQLKKGQPVTIRGEYDGRVSNVQVRECVLVQ